MASSNSRKKDRRSVREESRAVYRQAIMDAAIRIFGNTGYHDAKIADIAAEAGVATGTLYNYFGSKEDIFQSILDEGRERLEALIAEQLKITDPLRRLCELVRSMFEFLEHNGALFTMHMQVFGNPFGSRPQLNAPEDEFRRLLLTQITAALTEAGDRIRADYPAETLAKALAGVIGGALLDWIERGCQPGLSDHTDTLMDLFFHGATPR